MIPLSEFRQNLEVVPPTYANSRLEALLRRVIAQFERETKLLWNARTNYVETREPRPGSDLLLLALAPVTTIHSVETANADEDFVEVLSTAGCWRPYGDVGLRWIDSGSWPDRVRVTYDGGYTTAPDDIRFALIDQANYLYQRNQNIDVASKTIGSGESGGTIRYRAGANHPSFDACVKVNRNRRHG